jgi:4-hydroxy-2-oxoheptanedioate aldolase
MEMRRSRVLSKLRAGETAISYKTNLADARSVEIAARAGFDCVWTCMEHVGNDLSAIEQQVWAAKAYDCDLMVRVARGSYSDYVRPLELDAAGIMVPHVMSPEDAAAVVRMTRFHPVGRRPVDGGNADGAYCAIELVEYLRQANEQRFVTLQIEDPEPLEKLDEIAAVEGYDVLFFGPGDFSHGIGVPGQWEHPGVLEARKRVVEAALQHGKFAGTVATLDTVEEIMEMGYRFVNIGADVTCLIERCLDIVGQCRVIAEG